LLSVVSNEIEIVVGGPQILQGGQIGTFKNEMLSIWRTFESILGASTSLVSELSRS